MIVVSPLRHCEKLIETQGVSHAISLLSPDKTPPVFNLPNECHLTLAFNDIIEPIDGLREPILEDMEKIFSFADKWNREGGLLVHCWAGISRSTAAAFAIACRMNPDRLAKDIALDLRNLCPSATPNALMVHHADLLLKQNGSMDTAIRNIGRGKDAFEGEVFTLAL